MLGAYCEGADFTETHLEKAKSGGARLDHATMMEAHLEETILTGEFKLCPTCIS
jgi:uncharacterized protein YjbI with pentapeptide repeats